jgi:hypothetical protein
MKLPEFNTIKERNDFLVKNRKEISNFKKASVKFTETFVSKLKGETVKALTTSYSDDVASGVIKRTLIGNTYNWMDSQSDVLIDGCSAKSISEKSSDIFHLHDHLYNLTGKVGKPISIYEKSVAWKDLGVQMDGNTQALFMDSEIVKDYNAQIFAMYLKNEVDQHSIGLQYVQLDLAINDPEYKEEFSTWNKYINKIGNKTDVMDQGYFWAVTEIKLREISCVLMGSNELTPALENSKMEQLKANHEKKSEAEKQSTNIYSNLAEYFKDSPLK